MAEPTITRKDLRRKIARSLRSQFFSLYPEGELAVSTVGGGAATSFPCTSLTQEDDFWNRGYVYFLTAVNAANVGKERRIYDFASTGDTITLREPFPANISTGDTFEIHEIWSANDIHEAINRAISFVSKSFPKNVIFENWIIKEDTLTYPLSSLTERLNFIGSVYAEYNPNSVVFQPTGVNVNGSDLEITLPSGVIASDDQYNGWLVSIYGGTGAGQFTTITDTVKSTNLIKVLASAITTNPTTTSRMRLWNPNDQQTDWRKLRKYRTDFLEYPNNLYLSQRIPQYEGFRFRLIYGSDAAELTSDSSTTTVPVEYIINEAVAILHNMMTNDNRVDANRHSGLAQYHHQIALQFIQDNRITPPSITVPVENLGADYSNEEIDPLGWGYNG